MAEDDPDSKAETPKKEGRLKKKISPIPLFQRSKTNKAEDPAEPIDENDPSLASRISTLLDASQSDPKTRKDEAWLDLFWEKGVSKDNKRQLGIIIEDPVEEINEEPAGLVTDDYLYEEWMGISRKRKQKEDAETIILPIVPQLEEPQEQLMLPSGLEYAVLDGIDKQRPAAQEVNANPDADVDAPVDALDEMRALMAGGIEGQNDMFGNENEDEQGKKAKRSGKPLSRLDFALIPLLIILIVGVGAVIVRYSNLQKSVTGSAISAQPVSTMTPQVTMTATPQDLLPDPIGIQIAPGWDFNLHRSIFVDGNWKPAGPEWLVGAEVTRIVAIPWDPQLEKAVSSLLPGDEVQLRFDNKTTIPYKVQKAEQVPVSDSGKLNGSVPSLVIFLFGQDSPNRWVITCLP